MIYVTAVSTWHVRGSNGSSTTFEQSQLEVREHRNEGASLLVFWVSPEGGQRLVAGHEANWSFEEVDESATATEPARAIKTVDQVDQPPK